MDKDELLDYPYFFRLKMNNLNLNQNKTGGTVKSSNKRALSIVPSKSKILS